MKSYQLQLIPYSTTLNLILSKDCGKAAQILSKKFGQTIEWEQNFSGCTYEIEYKNKFFVLVLIDTNSLDLGIIVHESLHAANICFSQANCQLDVDNDEPQAYMLDYIFSFILKMSRIKVQYPK